MSSISGGRDPFLIDEKLDSETPVNPVPVPVGSDDESGPNPSPSPLSLGPNSKTERSSTGYGSLPSKPTVFGLNAKRSLIRSGGALEKTAPTEETLFLTGTLPGSTEDSFRAIACYSAYIVNSLKAWIANYVPQKLDFYCWEYQKRGALHLHYAVWVPSDESRNHIIAAFHGWWVQILHRVGDMASVDMFRKNETHTWLTDTSKVRAVAEVCRKSVARYLAKYLSKSASPTRGSARAFSPSRWWGVSRPLKALTDSMTSVCEVIESGYHAVRGVWEKIKQICDSSESVSHSYRHKVGEGSTLVLFTKEQPEREQLWLELVSMRIKVMEPSIGQSRLPSAELRILRNKQMMWLRESLISLSPSFQGLRYALDANLNWISKITPSTSQEPLSVLLAWAARLSDIRSMCQFTPAMSHGKGREIQGWLDTLEWAIEDVAKNGWR